MLSDETFHHMWKAAIMDREGLVHQAVPIFGRAVEAAVRTQCEAEIQKWRDAANAHMKSAAAWKETYEACERRSRIRNK